MPPCSSLRPVPLIRWCRPRCRPQIGPLWPSERNSSAARNHQNSVSPSSSELFSIVGFCGAFPHPRPSAAGGYIAADVQVAHCRRYAVSGGPDGAAARGGGGGGWQVRWGGQRIRRHWRWQQVQFTGTKIALGVAGMMVAAGLVVLALGFGSGPMCVC